MLLRDLGASLAPFNAYKIIQGIKTVALRIERQNQNANAVAEFLSKHKKIKRVIHPSFHTGSDKQLVDKYFPSGHYGALLGVELHGGADAGKAFIDNLQLIYHVANIGDSRTLAIHPASTTHSQLSPEEQEKTGVIPGYIRLSVGIEDVRDIIEDITQALEKVNR